MRVEPEPPKGSSTAPPGLEELWRHFTMSATGFIVGCSSERFGRGQSITETCEWSPYQRDPS
jgi:hypothetical protein